MSGEDEVLSSLAVPVACYLPTIGNGGGGTVAPGYTLSVTTQNIGTVAVLDHTGQRITTVRPRHSKLFCAVETPGFGWSYTDLPLTYPGIRVTGGLLPGAHTHPISDIVNLQTTLDGKAALVHTHIIGDTTGLLSALNLKADVVHSHVIADVTGLVLALAGKAPTSHTHDAADVSTGVLVPARLPIATTAADGAVKVDNNSAGDPVALTSAGHGAAADPHPQYALDTEKGAASGLATLDGSSKLTASQLPLGATATTAAAGNDSRLSDARTPTAHTHPASDVASGRLIAARLLDGTNGFPLTGKGTGVDPAYSSLVTVRLTADNAAIAAAAPTTALQVALLTQAANVGEEWDIEWIIDIANSVAADVFVFNVTSTAGTLTGRYTVEGTTGVPGTGAGVYKLLQQPAGTITVASANAPGATGTIGLVLTVTIRARVKLTVSNGTIQLLLRAGTNAAASSGTAVVKAQSQMIATRIV